MANTFRRITYALFYSFILSTLVGAVMQSRGTKELRDRISHLEKEPVVSEYRAFGKQLEEARKENFFNSSICTFIPLSLLSAGYCVYRARKERRREDKEAEEGFNWW